MRSWIGATENRRGHEFNKEVSERLRELGWQTKPNVKLTEILNAKLDRNYGDVDVFAWRDGRVLAVECKDLELAMTTSEIARQLYEFRGEFDVGGRPDRLKKHLLRVEVLKCRIAAVGRYVHSNLEVTIEPALVFNELVPMHFSEITTRHGIRLVAYDDLGGL